MLIGKICSAAQLEIYRRWLLTESDSAAYRARCRKVESETLAAVTPVKRRMKLLELNILGNILISPEELIDSTVYGKSVMTYLSQFPKARYVPPLTRVVSIDEVPQIGVATTFAIQLRAEQMMR